MTHQVGIGEASGHGAYIWPLPDSVADFSAMNPNCTDFFLYLSEKQALVLYPSCVCLWDFLNMLTTETSPFLHAMTHTSLFWKSLC